MAITSQRMSTPLFSCERGGLVHEAKGYPLAQGLEWSSSHSWRISTQDLVPPAPLHGTSLAHSGDDMDHATPGCDVGPDDLT